MADTSTESPPAASAPTQEPKGLDVQIGGDAPVTGRAPDPEPPSEEPADEPEETGEAPEDGEESPTDEPAAELPESWRDHADVKAAINESYRKGQSDTARGKDTEIEDVRYTTRRETIQTLADVHERELVEMQRVGASSGMVEAFKEAVETALEQNDDPKWHRTLADVLSRNKPWLDVYRGAQAEAMTEESVNALLRAPAFADGLDSGARRKISNVIADLDLRLRAGKIDYATVQAEALAARDKLRDAAITAQALTGEKSRLEELAKKKAGAEDRAADRNGRRMPAPTGGRAATGKTDAELLRDPTTPIETVIQIRNRQNQPQAAR